MWLVELFAVSLVIGSVCGVSVYFVERWWESRKA